LVGVWQTVAAFDLGEETLSDQEALLFQGGSEHHIGPQLEVPAWLARGRKG
jgi:hypothetical protein